MKKLMCKIIFNRALIYKNKDLRNRLLIYDILFDFFGYFYKLETAYDSLNFLEKHDKELYERLMLYEK